MEGKIDEQTGDINGNAEDSVVEKVDGTGTGGATNDGTNDAESTETVYVNNLNDKVSVNKLKGELESVFQKYGKIIQITAHKNLKMKGQAFVTFENKTASEAAIHGLQ